MKLEDVITFIPAEHKEIVKQICSKQKEYKRMIQSYNTHLLKKKRVEAMKISAYINKYELSEYIKYIESLNNQKVAVAELKSELGDDKSWEIAHKTNVALICVDIIESLGMEIEEALKPFLGRGRITLYDKIIEMSHEAKNIRRQIVDTGDMQYQCDFGDMSDQLRIMLETQVKLMTNKNIKKREDERREK